MYAVHSGRNPGIYQTWDECREQVIYFPNAKFKKFKRLSDAEQFVKDGLYEQIKNKPLVIHV